MSLASFGSIFAGIGTVAAGQAAGDALEVNAEVNRQNRDLALTVGEANVRSLTKKRFKTIGAQRVAAFGGGVANLSALDVMEETISESELDIQRARWKADLVARGFDIQADIDELDAHNIRQSSAIQGLAQGLGAVGGGGGGTTTRESPTTATQRILGPLE